VERFLHDIKPVEKKSKILEKEKSIDLAMDEDEKKNPFLITSERPMEKSRLNVSRGFLDITMDFGIENNLNVQESRMPQLL
jgi:hypothetical protein